MTKVTLNRDAFKALASDTRLDIIRTLDGKKMSLTELSKATSLNKATLHEHLNKLTEAGLVKRIQREGHKWVYYKLSWKGESLLHPENTKIVIVFSAAFTALIAGFVQLYLYISSLVIPNSIQEDGFLKAPSPEVLDESRSYISSQQVIPTDIWLYAGIICFLIFLILLVFSIHKIWKNKQVAL
jgi:DNA-binding transcriptional ArsR family regulator